MPDQINWTETLLSGAAPTLIGSGLAAWAVIWSVRRTLKADRERARGQQEIDAAVEERRNRLAAFVSLVEQQQRNTELFSQSGSMALQGFPEYLRRSCDAVNLFAARILADHEPAGGWLSQIVANLRVVAPATEPLAQECVAQIDHIEAWCARWVLDPDIHLQLFPDEGGS